MGERERGSKKSRSSWVADCLFSVSRQKLDFEPAMKDRDKALSHLPRVKSFFALDSRSALAPDLRNKRAPTVPAPETGVRDI